MIIVIFCSPAILYEFSDGCLYFVESKAVLILKNQTSNQSKGSNKWNRIIGRNLRQLDQLQLF